jgi:hypothetical protein
MEGTTITRRFPVKKFRLYQVCSALAALAALAIASGAGSKFG